MKKELLLFASLLCIGVSTAQNKDEVSKIVSSYNPESFSRLKSSFNKIDLFTQNKIDAYLLSNPTVQIQKKSEGKLYRIVDIIDGKPVYISTDNRSAALASRTNRLFPGGALGLSLEGEGMTVGVWDGGWVLKSHVEFNTPVARVVTPDNLAITPETNFHATHVAGTIGAAGVVSSSKGMAPKSNIKSYDWGGDLTEALIDISQNGLLISNHSYGVPIYNDSNELNVPVWYMGCYNDTAVSWDQLAYDYPYYLMVASAGNSGTDFYEGGLAGSYDKLTGNKNSKNNLVIANANPSVHPITGNITSLVINVGSSQGPTDDGRIKPDIAADGTNVYSTFDTNNNAYDAISGTSMSSPVVSGTLTLLQEHYNNLNSNFMKSASLRGLACHTALDDAEIPGPDTRFGWGLLDAQAAANVITGNNNGSALLLESTLTNGQIFTYTFSASSASTLKATICWTDPAGTSRNGQLNSPTPVLVNDLDLRVSNNTTTFLPWKIDLSNLDGGAIQGDNLVDNIERIDVVSPVAGQYTITVSHKGTLTSGSQAFSLILTGSDLVLNTNDLALQEVKIWPNPAKDVLNIYIPSLEDNTMMTIYDIHGRTVYAQEIQNQELNHSINTGNFSSGIYFLNIQSGSSSLTRKVIVE